MEELQRQYEDILSTIKNTTIYLHNLTEEGDVEKLNLYRIFLNSKIMEAVKLKKKIKLLKNDKR